MVEARELRKNDRVVRPIAAGGGRTCARPGCPALAHATLVFAYEAKTARMVGLLPECDPAAYDLCTTHADRTSPPFGWSLADERPPAPEHGPVDLADEDRTVAVISAALRAVPNPPRSSQVTGASAGRPVPAAGPGPEADAPEPTDDPDTLALVAAAEQLAGAEIEVALEELTELGAAAAAREAEPRVWRVTLDGDPADERLVSLTLPFDAPADGFEHTSPEADVDADEDDDLDEDAPLTPAGAAQLW